MDETKKLTPEEVDASVEEAKKRIKANALKSAKLVYGLHTDQQLAEYNNKKRKNRIRNKMQKLNRKKNR